VGKQRRNPIADLRTIVGRADALIIVPPFTTLTMPHLGAHVLQACALRRGFDVVVLYAGMMMAAEDGVSLYDDISACATPLMLGERVFCAAAYGLPHLGRPPHDLLRAALDTRHGAARTIRYDDILRLSHFAEEWTVRFGAAVAALELPLVGATTVFEQTAAAIALLNEIKRARGTTTTVIGGANCAGPMAHGIATLTRHVDYIFAGEAEEVFPQLLELLRAGDRPANRIIDSAPCQDMDGIPITDFSDFYRQWNAWMFDSGIPAGEVKLPYESSRGCWWGQKHHCTFCGVQNMRFREKSADRVIAELRALLSRHPSRKVRNADDIMPSSFFKTLIPRLPAELPDVEIFYEQKANLTLEKARALRRAGVSVIQPGIEALSTPLLRRMRKGTEAWRNLALMRYARAASLRLTWNLLYGFPGDTPEDYAHYPRLLPLIRHLEPPQGFGPVHIIRFSPYFKESMEHGVRDVRPAPVYADILPDGADTDSLAYYFDARYESVTTTAPDLVQAIAAEVESWAASWNVADGAAPMLRVLHFAPDVYVLADTRGIDNLPEIEIITPAQAAAALAPGRLSGNIDAETRWALGRKVAFADAGWSVPLATADPELIAAFERPPRSLPEEDSAGRVA
jgi:ribosomal peptide maturation radical SAM protein 1